MLLASSKNKTRRPHTALLKLGCDGCAKFSPAGTGRLLSWLPEHTITLLWSSAGFRGKVNTDLLNIITSNILIVIYLMLMLLIAATDPNVQIALPNVLLSNINPYQLCGHVPRSPSGMFPAHY